jgi:hypothetical protein
MADEKWWNRATCQGQDLNLFYDEERGDGSAKFFCASSGCPVVMECLKSALIEEEAEMEEFGYAQRTGVRGGIGPEERSRIADGQYVKKVRRGQN